MKRFCAIVTFFCLTASAQELTQDDFNALIPYLQKEDYNGAFGQSEILLKKSTTDTSDARAQIAYVNVYAAAGMVTVGQMSHKDFEKHTKRFIGQKMKMPGHPFVDDTVKVAFNSFKLLRDKDKVKGFTMTANQKKTNILLFEYYNFEQAPDPKEFSGKTVRASGILESFEVNPDASKTWIARLHFAKPQVNIFIPNR